MQLLPLVPTAPLRPGSTPSAPSMDRQPPAQWTRWWTSPLASVEYGTGSSVTLWREALIPARRTPTGARIADLSYGGSSVEAAIAAARQLAAAVVNVSFSDHVGVSRTVQVHPAIAVLRDAAAGAYWLAPLQTTVQQGEEWVDAPHAIDGPAFEGADAALRTPTVLSATRDMVAVVGGSRVQHAEHWRTAPDDSILDQPGDGTISQSR